MQNFRDRLFAISAIRLRLNANAFYMRFEDQQVEMRTDPLDPLSNRVTNAASSESYGFEIEPNYRVTETLEVFASVGYVHTEFLEFEDVNLGDLSGLRGKSGGGRVEDRLLTMCGRYLKVISDDGEIDILTVDISVGIAQSATGWA